MVAVGCCRLLETRLLPSHRNRLGHNREMLTSRRDLIALASRAAALPGGSEFFAAWLKAADEHKHPANSSAPPEPPLFRDYKPQFFSPEDFESLQAFTEILIPTDDTPGTREAHCAHFIDFLVHSAAESAPDMQTQWRNTWRLCARLDSIPPIRRDAPRWWKRCLSRSGTARRSTRRFPHTG